jgi:hypothetical protein
MRSGHGNGLLFRFDELAGSLDNDSAVSEAVEGCWAITALLPTGAPPLAGLPRGGRCGAAGDGDA